MKGKLIVIEGTDGSGKATQSKLLYERVLKENLIVKKVEYPDYNSLSSSLVKMYLSGEFGSKPEDVNAYAASTFFAVDRFASYKTKWKDFYLNGGIVIADRYVTSNMVHQASKIEDETERLKYLDWLYDLEFVKMGLPVPDMVVFLDMPPDLSRELIKDRENKFTGDKVHDIHEDNREYLMKSYRNSLKLSEKYEWIKIPCTIDGKLRSIEEIHLDVYREFEKMV